MHGEAVLRGLLVCSELQGQENAFIYDIARLLDLLSRLRTLDIDEEFVAGHLLKANQLRRDRFTVFNICRMAPPLAETIATRTFAKLLSL